LVVGLALDLAQLRPMALLEMGASQMNRRAFLKLLGIAPMLGLARKLPALPAPVATEPFDSWVKDWGESAAGKECGYQIQIDTLTYSLAEVERALGANNWNCWPETRTLKMSEICDAQ
jgi:hypothetical protein